MGEAEDVPHHDVLAVDVPVLLLPLWQAGTAGTGGGGTTGGRIAVMNWNRLPANCVPAIVSER